MLIALRSSSSFLTLVFWETFAHLPSDSGSRRTFLSRSFFGASSLGGVFHNVPRNGRYCNPWLDSGVLRLVIYYRLTIFVHGLDNVNSRVALWVSANVDAGVVVR